MTDDAKTLWAAQMALDFPADPRGMEVNEIDLVYLDSSAAGAVTSGIDGRPDIALIRTLLAELREVEPHLTGEVAHYFAGIRRSLEALDR